MKKKVLLGSLNLILFSTIFTSCKRICDVRYTDSISTSQIVDIVHSHSYNEWKIVSDPTTNATGLMERSCTVCSDIDRFILPVLNETNYTYSVIKASTCTTIGKAKYVYKKDGDTLEIPVDLTAVDITNHPTIDDNDYCTECGNYVGLHYGNFDENDSTCYVTGFGYQIYWHPNFWKYGRRDVTIPETITRNDKTYTVIGIANNAFQRTDSLMSIKFPKTIKTIGDYAFESCRDLISIEIPEDTSLESIGNGAFQNCNRSLKSVEIPSTVTSIGVSAFEACSKLETVKIKGNVTSIENYTFKNCVTLKEVELPDTVTTIGDAAFEATALVSITIPSGVTSINGWTFKNCSKLESITFLGDVTSIGQEALLGTTSLKSITLPDTLTTLCQSAFYECGLKEVIIPNSVTSMIQYTFQNSQYLESVKILADVETLPFRTFQYCLSLKTVEITGNVKTIGEAAFYNCVKLESITLPESLTTIGNYAFYECSSLKSIVLPKNITTIGTSPFFNSVEEIYVKGTKDDPTSVSLENKTSEFSLLVYYYSEEEPDSTSSDSYWHYDSNNKPVKW